MKRVALASLDDMTPPLRPIPAVNTLRDARCEVLRAIELSGPHLSPAVEHMHRAEEMLAALIDAQGGW